MIDKNWLIRLRASTELFRQSLERMTDILKDLNTTAEIQVWENEGGSWR